MTAQKPADAKPMSLKSAMHIFERLESEEIYTTQILQALNVVVNSKDVAHMSRKGLHIALQYLAANLNKLSVIEGGPDVQSEAEI